MASSLHHPRADIWRGRRVLLTGHTGFKGGWLAIWMARRGAEVHGYALDPPTDPSFFAACRVDAHVASDTRADIRDADALRHTLRRVRPEVVLHLAAQPLVRHGYRDPIETLDVNVMGTARLLEAVREEGTARAVVVITTDKCYENREWDWAYREHEPLGGADPYSASKACAELVCDAYRRSFLAASGIRLATARAGNVIGGGDWAADRLVPDFLRAIDADRPLVIRAPGAVRPWQHVLEPLSGYLLLAERLLTDGCAAEAWNFGPDETDARTVGWIADHLCRLVPGARWMHEAGSHPHEAGRLAVDSAKARRRLDWRPRWRLEEALERTVVWHRAWRAGADVFAVTEAQIAAHEATTEPGTTFGFRREREAA
jgi:CDP-glucose 4,6-dehydratase